ncbi:hypothetical protein SELMODRAFT_229708 [Selaginella moellendorffii]|uniref:NADH-ubiquinone oxidoreductase 21kDa subunit N-terminal domain-containing protein n=1 Tax=Selaginella moellendorffii TaxID=88036 RepID=D8TAT4_SELML|nr:uncharacterized protein LOC9630559 [Selaginella moellendorffii]EFJ05217.1 hypothetical protein SELMODRAFT_229768 [Selaginella moellendorffii]EFJ06207.1 hypothetical protein SELMODRAFT_229708 [Selaginella moellendorffii]|eukprot:XP_002992726.1 uncharacterized protein LOC9630559 [Selaginella moellendorffii]
MPRRWVEPPEYPVIYEFPKVSAVVSNFSFRDMMHILTYTSASVPFGYLAGASARVKGPAMVVAALTGLQAGYMVAYIYSKGRLMGIFPNDDEVARLGMSTMSIS